VTQRRLTFLLTVLAVLVAIAASPRGWADPPTKDADSVALVQRLGGKRFPDREAAAAKLIALGTKAKPAVRDGTRDPDAEVARRCQDIIKKIREDERDAFLAGRLDWPGPAGRKFRDVVGSDAACRKLYGEVLAVEACCEAVERFADMPGEADKFYAAELARLKQAWKAGLAEYRPADLTNVRLRQESRLRVQPGDVALVLLLQTFRKPADTGGSDGLYELLSASFMDLARSPAHGKPFRKLVVDWLDRQPEAGGLNAGLEAALLAPVPEAAPVARRALKNAEASEAAIGRAILLLGHHGRTDDLEAIGRFRSDTRPYQPYERADGKRSEVQVRDIAAVMSLRIRGSHAAANDFTMFRASTWWSEPGFYATPLPFPTAEAREAAHKKAWAWLDEQA
jgi:hypothetical protein